MLPATKYLLPVGSSGAEFQVNRTGSILGATEPGRPDVVGAYIGTGPRWASRVQHTGGSGAGVCRLAGGGSQRLILRARHNARANKENQN